MSRALLNASKADEQEAPEFIVVVKNLAYDGVPAGELRSDNGVFHVAGQADRHSAWGLRVWVTGIGRQLSFIWNPAEDRAEGVRATSISQSQLLRSQTMRDDGVPMRIRVTEGPVADVGDLARFLISRDKLKRKLPVEQSAKGRPEAARSGDAVTLGEGEPRPFTDALPVGKLWQALMDAEEEAFLTVTIAGEHRRNPYQENQVLIPYHSNGRVLDYAANEKIIVESLTNDGTWRSCGTLNLRDTTFGQLAELAVDFPFMKANLRIGAKLRLMSTGDMGSYDKRRVAVDRILSDKAVVPGLIDYFEPLETASNLQPVVHPSPTDQDLDEYSDGDKKLNASQKEAFRRVLGNGPVSLLQGPPGTGKTWFIAVLLHYLMSRQRARRILLVSQAHEAVNNALEKGQELCRNRGIEFDAVRIGPESAASDEIRHLHSTSIEQSYRDRFKAEHKERVVGLAIVLGLPKAFAEQMIDLHLRLGMLNERIKKLQMRGEGEDDRASTSKQARIRALTETFFDIAADVYEVSKESSTNETLAQIETALLAEHEIRSADGVDRLKKLLALSEDWLNTLGASDTNFTEFLAKSRTVVAGMCGAETHKTVEHVLPRKPWSEFSFFSPNLVPSCATCNNKRGNRANAPSTSQRLLHPYFDKAALQRRLHVTKINGPYDAPEFMPDVCTPLSPSLTARVRHHMKHSVDLTVYHQFCNNRWSELKQEVKWFNTKPALKKRLRILLGDSVSISGPNSWKTAFYAGVVGAPAIASWLFLNRKTF